MPFEQFDQNLAYPVYREQRFDDIENWNGKLDCTNPGNIVITDGLYKTLRAVPCRKCFNCLRHRQKQWMYRGAVEFTTHKRTWFVTLSWRPAQVVTYEHVKLFLKRVRRTQKEKPYTCGCKMHDGAKHAGVRYLCSEEFGENGTRRKHWHLLLHGSDDLSWRNIASEWDHGFMDAKLARTSNLASYIAKYAAKSGRIRASRFYGEESGCHHVERWPARDFDWFFQTGSKSDQLEALRIKLTRKGIIFSDLDALATMVKTDNSEAWEGCPF